MVQTITRREYVVVCDGCRRAGPAADSPEHAAQLVRSLDWQLITPLHGFTFLTTWLCADCHQHRDSPASGARRI